MPEETLITENNISETPATTGPAPAVPQATMNPDDMPKEYVPPKGTKTQSKKKCKPCKWMFLIGLLLVLLGLGYYVFVNIGGFTKKQPTEKTSATPVEKMEVKETTEVSQLDQDAKKDTDTVAEELIKEIDALDLVDIDSDFSDSSLDDLAQ
jgi:cytoskeletal protein RodZ